MNMQFFKQLVSYSYKANYASCKLSKGSHFLLFHEKESKMIKIHEKENLRGL